MGYNKLGESTLTSDERIAEATRLHKMLLPFYDEMTPNAQSLMDRVGAVKSFPPSPQQLFWLRDLREKFLG